MPTLPKVITKLRERRQIEAELRKMSTARSEAELRQRARQIAALGPQVIPAIVGNLDRADSQLLTAIGMVTLFLDREEVIAALHQAVRHPQRTEQGRVSALTVLERFLGEPPDDELLTALREAPLLSLDTVLSRAEADPTVLSDYVQQLDRQDPDTVLAVCRELAGVGSPGAVELLRLMAQDVRAEIAAEAVRICATIRRPEAARGLQTLLPIIHPELRPLTERSLRRLLFVGVKIEDLPSPDPDWRALVSPVDGVGQQSVWFIQPERRTAQARFLNILLDDQMGAVNAAAHDQAPVAALPPQRPVGHLHDVILPDGSGSLLMLEVPFDMGRRLVRDALALNRRTQVPVTGPLRLRSPWLWAAAGADELPPRALPEIARGEESLWTVSDLLLSHPAFATWTVQSEAILEAASDLQRRRWDRETWIKQFAAELAGEPVVVEVLSERLLVMSEWLLISGDKTRSRIALVTARRLRAGGVRNMPLLRELVRRDLENALRSSKESEADSRRGIKFDEE